MSTRTIKHRAFGLVDVKSFPTNIRGLSICGPAIDDGLWTISHDRSGLALVYSESVEALAFACTFLHDIDWTRPAAELQHDDAAIAAGRAAADAIGDDAPRSHRGDPTDLSPLETGDKK